MYLELRIYYLLGNLSGMKESLELIVNQNVAYVCLILDYVLKTIKRREKSYPWLLGSSHCVMRVL